MKNDDKELKPLPTSVTDSLLDAGYKAMALDVNREKDALEWCNALIW